MKIKNLKIRDGFSLLEIIITVAIISIMASGVTIGFGSFIQTVRLQETKAVITDTINNLASEALRNQYKKLTVHFDKDYLVIEGEAENQSLSLNWNGKGACAAGQEELEIDNTGSSDAAYFTFQNKNGNNASISTIDPSIIKTICVDFINAKETEWQYQLSQNSDVSQVIRFIHFNIRRDDNAEPVKITAGTNYTIKISAPYAIKKFYDNGSKATGTVALTIENDGATETVILRE